MADIYTLINKKNSIDELGKTIEILKNLRYKKQHDTISRITLNRVLVESIVVDGELKHLIGIKGIQNGFGATARDNAAVTFDLIVNLAKYLNHDLLWFYDDFKYSNLPAQKRMFIGEFNEEFITFIRNVKLLNKLNFQL